MQLLRHRDGGAPCPQNLPVPPEGAIPRSSDPTQATIVINESRSLYSSEHLNSRPPEAPAAHFTNLTQDTNPPKCPPHVGQDAKKSCQQIESC